MRYETAHDPVPKTICVRGSTVFGHKNIPSLVIPVHMVQGDLKVLGTALIDSGAQGNFIDR